MFFCKLEPPPGTLTEGFEGAMTVAEEPLIAGEATEGASSPGTAPGDTADGHRLSWRWRAGAALTDMEAVTTGNCSLSSGDPGLILSCGRDRIAIPEDIR